MKNGGKHILMNDTVYKGFCGVGWQKPAGNVKKPQL